MLGVSLRLWSSSSSSTLVLEGVEEELVGALLDTIGAHGAASKDMLQRAKRLGEGSLVKEEERPGETTKFIAEWMERNYREDSFDSEYLKQEEEDEEEEATDDEEDVKEDLKEENMSDESYDEVSQDKAMIQCPKCPKKYRTKNGMWTHKCEAHGDKMNSCDQCGKTFRFSYSLKRHIELRDERGKCPDKNVDIRKQLVEFDKLSEAQQMSRIDQIHRANYQDCSCTSDCFVPKDKLDQFKIFHLSYEPCQKCNTVTNLLEHTCKNNPKKPRQKKTANRQIFFCYECGIVFHTRSSFNTHRHSKHDNELAQCHICSKHVPKLELSVHVNGKHKPKEACSVCGKFVARLKLHMETMHQDDSEMKERCDVCGKGFPNSRTLSDHKMSVHLKLRPWACRYGCDQAYNDKSNRRQHEKRAHGVVGPREATYQEKRQAKARLENGS